jgi:predicted PurR-regulated permease PerM
VTTPKLVILIGVIGETFAHGIIDLFIGPIILSVAQELMAACGDFNSLVRRMEAHPACSIKYAFILLTPM